MYTIYEKLARAEIFLSPEGNVTNVKYPHVYNIRYPGLEKESFYKNENAPIMIDPYLKVPEKEKAI